jgi:hypothetical protein
MAHTPVNHPLRPVYRALSGLAGIYLVLFGVLGIIQTAGDGMFATGDIEVLGQGSNLANSILSLVVGAIVLIAAVLGRNLDVAVNTYTGWGLVVLGSVMLAAIRTDANILNYGIATVIVTYTIGMLLITAGLYCKVVPSAAAGAPRQARQSEANA